MNKVAWCVFMHVGAACNRKHVGLLLWVKPIPRSYLPSTASMAGVLPISPEKKRGLQVSSSCPSPLWARWLDRKVLGFINSSAVMDTYMSFCTWFLKMSSIRLLCFNSQPRSSVWKGFGDGKCPWNKNFQITRQLPRRQINVFGVWSTEAVILMDRMLSPLVSHYNLSSTKKCTAEAVVEAWTFASEIMLIPVLSLKVWAERWWEVVWTCDCFWLWHCCWESTIFAEVLSRQGRDRCDVWDMFFGSI